MGLASIILAGLVAITFPACRERVVDGPKPEPGITVNDFEVAASNIFAQMDQVPDGNGGLKPLELNLEEIKGRNSWILWTAGDQDLWNHLSKVSFGAIDLLKLIDTKAGPERSERFEKYGLINEPGFKQASEPGRYGLWLDVPEKQTGGRTFKAPPYGRTDRLLKKQGLPYYDYGYSSGVMGLRIYPNPKFDQQARKVWDANKWRNNSDYYRQEDLVRPYRVGISCGVCHVAFNPLNPPQDPAEPNWANLSSAIGNQYLREGKVFGFGINKAGPKDFFWQLAIGNQPAGTSDTSRLATDHINNPNTINAIFNVEERVRIAQEEKLSGDTLNLPGAERTRKVPHILKDGADSVGIPGATIRVYVNIGLFQEYWLSRHDSPIGVKAQEPFKVGYAQENSVWWRATEKRLPYEEAFLRTIEPMHLRDAPGGEKFITNDPKVLRRGKVVFAEHCARCHSSKQPTGIDPTSEEATAWFRQKILDEDSTFWENNFFSDDRRYPVTEIKSNAGRALASNAAKGHIWGSFSSETYKELPPVGIIRTYDPTQPDEPRRFTASNPGLGYYRTPSLISVWSSAPLLHNNALGDYTGDPSVEGRVRAFEDAMEKLLWPSRRRSEFEKVEAEPASVVHADPEAGRSGNRPGALQYERVTDETRWRPTSEAGIWKTTKASYVEIPKEAFPGAVRKILERKGMINEDGLLQLGPIPKGTPVSLLGSLDLSLKEPGEGVIDVTKRAAELTGLLIDIKKALAETEGMPEGKASAYLKQELVPRLLEASQCPDLVVDRGHYFGSQLSDEAKNALIEFLKTL